MEAESFRIAKVFSNGGDIHFRLPFFSASMPGKNTIGRHCWKIF